MIYSKIGLGLWAQDYLFNRELSSLVDDLNPDVKKVVTTPDDAYYVFYWDFKCWSGEKVEALTRCIKDIRHSLIIVSEEGNIFRDNKTWDNNGCDEEFEELLSWKTDVLIWDNVTVTETLTNNRLMDILSNIVDNAIEGSERIAAVNLLKEAGMKKHEMIACGFDWLFDDEVSIEELNKVLSFVDLKAETTIYGDIIVEDLQGTCALTDEYFEEPKEVILRIKDSYLADTFLDGDVCCNLHGVKFDTYEEAEKVARKEGYAKEADAIHIIVKAIMN